MSSRAVPLSILYLFDSDPNVGAGVSAPVYALGVQTASNSIWWHAGPLPDQWVLVGTGSGGGGSQVRVIHYTVGGGEPDLSEIAIAVSPPMADASYGVVASCQGCASLVSFDIPDGLKSASGFVAVMTGALQEGDRLVFFLSPVTSSLVGPPLASPVATIASTPTLAPTAPTATSKPSAQEST